MIQNKNWNIVYLDESNSNGYTMSKFLSTSGFKWMVPKKFHLPLIIRKFVLEVDLGYPKELSELHNDYSLAPGEKIKRKLLSNYQF